MIRKVLLCFVNCFPHVLTIHYLVFWFEIVSFTTHLASLLRSGNFCYSMTVSRPVCNCVGPVHCRTACNFPDCTDMDNCVFLFCKFSWAVGPSKHGTLDMQWYNIMIYIYIYIIIYIIYILYILYYIYIYIFTSPEYLNHPPSTWGGLILGC